MEKLRVKKLELKSQFIEVLGLLGTKKEKFSGEGIIISCYGVKFKNYLNYRQFISIMDKTEKELSDGYYVEIEFLGLGYRFINIDEDLLLRVGYSHYVYYKVPKNLLVFGFRKRLVIFSSSKENVMKTLGQLRSIRRSNSYKQKGLFLKGGYRKLKEIKVSKK